MTGLACAGAAILGALTIIAGGASTSEIPRTRLFLIVVFVVTYVTLFTFIAAYPLFYTNTLDRIWETFYTRGQILNYQIYTYSHQGIQPGERLGVLFQRIFEYPVRFASPSRLINIPSQWINFITALIGALHSIRQAWGTSNRREAYIALLLCAVFGAGPMLLTPFDWERYYMFPIFFTCIFFSIGAGWIFFRLKSWVESPPGA